MRHTPPCRIWKSSPLYSVFCLSHLLFLVPFSDFRATPWKKHKKVGKSTQKVDFPIDFLGCRFFMYHFFGCRNWFYWYHFLFLPVAFGVCRISRSLPVVLVSLYWVSYLVLWVPLPIFAYRIWRVSQIA